MGCDRCRTNLSGGPQGKNPCSRTQNTYCTYNKPLSANETIVFPLPATMKWSRTRASISANEAFSVCATHFEVLEWIVDNFSPARH